MSATQAGQRANPFPGLRPFREDEEHLFFGRENQVDAMVDKLAKTHFLAVVGTSGSGKSSLVNCGLRPGLRRGLMARAGTAWRMVQFRPGNDPIGAMAHAVAEDGVLFRDRITADLSLAEIIETNLRMSKLGLVDIYGQAALGDGVNLLVVVDQFEELFRFRQLRSAGAGGAGNLSEDAIAFVNLLLEVRQNTTGSIFIVLTMRSDFLGDCTQFPGLAEAINTGQYLVPRLTRDERRAAIEGPVRVARAEISPVLLTRLVNDVGDNPDQLSILQHALNRTWARWQDAGEAERPLDLTDYEAIGTMAHALDQHAEQAFAELGDGRLQQMAEKVFKALTDKATDPRGVRRPTTLGNLCELAQATEAEISDTIAVFRDPGRSFLMPPAGEALLAETVIDISHESLMRVWQRLIRWADQEAESARIYRRLAETADLNAAGNAPLLRDPELQRVLCWRDKSQPNESWAARYHPGFDTAMRFLDQSREAREAERAEQQRHRQRELDAEREKAESQARYARRMRGMASVASVFALIAALLGGWGWYSSYWAQERQRQAKTYLGEAEITASRMLIKDAEDDRVDPGTQILLALEALPDKEERPEWPFVREAQNVLIDRINSLHELAVLGGRLGPVTGVAVTPDGTRIVTGSADGTVRVWDAKSRTELRQLRGHKGAVWAVAVTPDGTRIVTGSADGMVRLWDANSGTELVQLSGHEKAVLAVAVTPDGTRIVTRSADGTARVWNASSGTKLLQPRGHKEAIRAVALTPDGTRIITGSTDGTVRVWDASSGAELLQVTGHKGEIHTVAVTPDGTRILTGSDDGTVQVWDASSGTELPRLRLFEPAHRVVALTPDGTRIATGSDDGTVRLWDASSGAELLQLRGHKGAIQAVAVTADGTRIVTGSDDGTARLWDLAQIRPPFSPQFGPDANQAIVNQGKTAVPRCLTIEQRQEFLLDPRPPGWCIDMHKYPYDTEQWRAWRAGQLAGRTVKVDPADPDISKALGNYSDQLLEAGSFRAALESAGLSLQFYSNKNGYEMNKAHAYMFLDRTDEAREIYLAHRGECITFPDPQGRWEQAILRDFEKYSTEGRHHPFMDKIKGRLEQSLSETKTKCG